MKKTTAPSPKKREIVRDPKFRVIPNLSLKGKDIMKRLQNRSLILDGMTGNYTLEEQWDAMRRMTKADAILAAQKNANQIKELSNKLQNG